MVATLDGRDRGITPGPTAPPEAEGVLGMVPPAVRLAVDLLLVAVLLVALLAAGAAVRLAWQLLGALV